MQYVLTLPEDFEDYASEVQSKGWFSGATLLFAGKLYRLNFYDPVRLAQDVESELEGQDTFFEPNVVVVRSVTRENMRNAVGALIDRGVANLLAAEPK